MEYNTQRADVVLREYGRHIQKMVEHLTTIEDREKRNQQAKAVIELMGFLNPQLKNVDDFKHILWDHLFVISKFCLDVDSPHPIPTKETYKVKPAPLPYPVHHPRYAHLGKNLEKVIEQVLQEQDPNKKTAYANSIAFYMKLAYSNWHKELVSDESIRRELDNITGGQLEFSATPHIKHIVQPANKNNGRNKNNNRNNGKNKNNAGRNNNRRNQETGNPRAGFL